jgi:hypothetical protein
MPIRYEDAKIIKAPEPLPVRRVKGVVPQTVFLAGSIEMGKAIDWQADVSANIKNYAAYIFNPRRDDWDSSWEQSVYNDQFNTQVSWEMTALDIAEVIFMYFAPETKSPISLLELGLYAKSEKMIVCCPGNFWRSGNVGMVCQRYGIPLYTDLKNASHALKEKLANRRLL